MYLEVNNIKFRDKRIHKFSDNTYESFITLIYLLCRVK